MDLLSDLSADLARVLDRMQQEAAATDRRELMAPLAWLDEASAWLRYELARSSDLSAEPVPFTYVPLAYRK